MGITYRGFVALLTPTPLCAAPRGRGGSMRLLFPLWLKRRLSLEFFFKKQILCQTRNQIQIGTNARSKGSQRELFILKTTFPPGQEVPACAWHDGSAPLSCSWGPAWCLRVDSELCWVLLVATSLWPSQNLSGEMGGKARTSCPEDLPAASVWNRPRSLGALGSSSLDFCQNRQALCVKEKVVVASPFETSSIGLSFYSTTSKGRSLCHSLRFVVSNCLCRWFPPSSTHDILMNLQTYEK